MNFRNAKKLHNGDEVGVRAYPGTIQATVLNAYILPIEPKVVRVDVLTVSGAYYQELRHDALI